VTGEGALDEQTIGGKLLFEVATRARQSGIPCYAVVGRDELDRFEHRLMNIEVEAATPNGGIALVADVERAARRVAHRLLR
jgi:glycerate kinase